LKKMKKIKIYIETSVWNFFFADDSPEKYEEDAVHIANSSVNSLDILVSWNMKHIRS